MQREFEKCLCIQCFIKLASLCAVHSQAAPAAGRSAQAGRQDAEIEARPDRQLPAVAQQQPQLQPEARAQRGQPAQRAQPGIPGQPALPPPLCPSSSHGQVRCLSVPLAPYFLPEHLLRHRCCRMAKVFDVGL